ncbi:TPA: alpha/beta hydrolase [Klebsiella oxytoca]|uniref:alpha/beta fold hydrolase n=1 Tax=Klebsiella oxytoca TaxID=571 RepID=UPI0013D04F11|nr:alpha/beta hydrolase [Klebsiella oxytoca]EKW2357358.1 alpha/beta hydrolase [Klebsiella oxytoca]EKW2420568.1 alpha/beta hydrolase [Klebsiella oxytoca]EKW2423524.1 alpha/beta hydrolase [Klebsiella oxytoca]ELK0738789.1 alpha/beta hydrolase [Klebsiella oxytoca]ELK0740368.1 alpha/beta hydrolase [Klebsiella oxytoca]
MSSSKNAENLPVVLIPGFMLDETLWDDFIAAFPDSRPFIPASLNEGTTIQDIAASIAQKLSERFVLVGFSLGGYVARAIYEAIPERTAAMILIATSLREDSAEQNKTRVVAASTPSSREFRGLSTIAIKKSIHEDLADNITIIEKIRNMGKRLGANAFRVQSGLNRERITLKPVSCPAYVIAAKHDRLRSKDEAEELARLTGTCADYVDGCGHMIPLEKPDELAQLVFTWLTKKGL